MKTMLYSDFTIIKSYLPQQLFVCVVVAIFLCFGMKSVYAVIPAVAYAGSFTIIFAMLAIDENNGWDRFRLSLPLSKGQIIRGRYTSVLTLTVGFILLSLLIYALLSLLAQVGLFSFDSELTAEVKNASWQITSLLVTVSFIGMITLAALIFPFTSRFGMTRAVRLLPLGIVVIVFIAAWVIGAVGDRIETTVDSFFTQVSTPEGAIVLIAIATIGTLIIYGISCLIATKLYEKREF